MSEKLDYARAEIENLLAQAEKVFIKEQGMKLTFIARHPTIQERYMIYHVRRSARARAVYGIRTEQGTRPV